MFVKFYNNVTLIDNEKKNKETFLAVHSKDRPLVKKKLTVNTESLSSIF